MLYAWPFDSTDQMSEDDLYLTDTNGFVVGDMPNYQDAVAQFQKNQEAHEEWPVGFWLVPPETDQAARKVPYGETDAQTLRNTALRKSILNSGAVKTLLP